MVSLHPHILLGWTEADLTEDKPDVAPYPYGSRGPEGLEEFTAKYGHYKRFDDD
jgi:hypothetical protein